MVDDNWVRKALYGATILAVAAIFLLIGLTGPALFGWDRPIQTELILPAESGLSPSLSEPAEPVTTASAVPDMSLFPYSLNEATKDQLMTVPGMAEPIADSILLFREKGGRFEFYEDILHVAGVTWELARQWAIYLTV